MANTDNSKKQSRKLLGVIWILFIVVLGIFGFYVYTKRDNVADDLGITTRFSYQTNANQDINALIITYLNAYASCEAYILRSIVFADIFCLK